MKAKKNTRKLIVATVLVGLGFLCGTGLARVWPVFGPIGVGLLVGGLVLGATCSSE